MVNERKIEQKRRRFVARLKSAKGIISSSSPQKVINFPHVIFLNTNVN